MKSATVYVGATNEDAENYEEEKVDNLGTTENDGKEISKIRLEDLSFMNDNDQASENVDLEEWE